MRWHVTECVVVNRLASSGICVGRSDPRGVGNVSRGSRKVLHSVGKDPNVVGEAPHSVRKVPHNVGKVHHSVRKVPHSVRKVPHRVRKVPQSVLRFPRRHRRFPTTYGTDYDDARLLSSLRIRVLHAIECSTMVSIRSPTLQHY